MKKCYGYDDEMGLCLLHGCPCDASADNECYHTKEEVKKDKEEETKEFDTEMFNLAQAIEEKALQKFEKEIGGTSGYMKMQGLTKLEWAVISLKATISRLEIIDNKRSKK